MQLIKSIFNLLQKQEQRKMLQLTILDVIVSLLDIFFLVLLVLFVGFYTGTSRLPQTFTWLTFLLNKQPMVTVAVFSFLFIIKNWFAYAVTKKQYYFVYQVASRLSERKLSEYFDDSYTNYVNADSSVHMRSVFNNCLEFAHYILRGVQQVISQGVLIIFTLIPVIIFKPVLFTLLSLILVPPIILLWIFQKKKLLLLRDDAKTINTQLVQKLKEALSAFVESNIFHSKKFFVNRFVQYQHQQSRSLSEQQIAQTLPSRLIEVFVVLGLFTLIILNYFTNGRSVDAITIGAFMAAAYKTIPGIVKIWNGVTQIKTYEFVINDLAKHSSEQKQIKKENGFSIDTIRFDNVSFSYKDKRVINELNFEINRGDFVCISSVSGKGKTTLLNLMLGFLEPQQGKVLVNNVSLEHIRDHSWKRISYAKQQPFFIHDSALQNVVFATDYDMKNFEAAADAAGFKTFINGSLHKTITENGKNISGGQRQRIALARALYKDFDVLILDEPFSELDERSELEILEKLQSFTKDGKMVLLVTHNESALGYCNKIISLDE